MEAQNRDAFMAVKQDLLLAFVDCVERNRAELARVRVAVRPRCHAPEYTNLLPDRWPCPL